MNRKRIPRVKIVINNKIIQQVTEFTYLDSHLSQYNNQKDIDRNLTLSDPNLFKEIKKRNLKHNQTSEKQIDISFFLFHVNIRNS